MAVVTASYPLLDAFLTTLWIVGFFLWIWLVIIVFADIFRSRDLSGWGKAGWTLLVFIIPLFGVLIYLVARGKNMRRHAEEDATMSDLATREYIRSVVSSGDSTDEMSKLDSLHESGVISDEEYERMKARLLQPT
jgi:hypothetical protein